MTGIDSTGDEGRLVPPGVAEALSALARSLRTEPDLPDTLAAIVKAAVDTVPGTEDAGLALIEHGQIHTVAQTSARIKEADELQYRLAEGPCVDAVWQHRIFRVDDMGQEARWPRFAPAMTDLGVWSMLSFRLFLAGDTLGVLNLFSSQVRAFDSDSERVGELFATHAAVALAGSQAEAQLEIALNTRDLIGTAKGIIAERHQITTEHAFRLLVGASQNTNVKLAAVARSLVAAADQVGVNRRSGGSAAGLVGPDDGLR